MWLRPKSLKHSEPLVESGSGSPEAEPETRLGLLEVSLQQKQVRELQRQGFRPGPRLHSPAPCGGLWVVPPRGRRGLSACAGRGEPGEAHFQVPRSHAGRCWRSGGSPQTGKGGPRAYGWRTPSFTTARLLGEGADCKPGRCLEDEVRAEL